MMYSADLNTKPQYCKWRAVQDVRLRNAVNSTRYTDSEKLRAERMKLALELVYRARGIYVNFRKTKIAVKVDDAAVKDRANLALLEQDWAARGVKKAVSAQGVIYSFTH